ncbi:hypothetical protein [Streptomyces lavendulae]|uniref:hypothetical protein n=1 Tax=Streptomyces lavendulae TaxID=1914 RepID=UPI0024A3AE68|nr:hypothetical protein [Streptomyces lavendulae]GLW02679.1 hypothetical protein Slala05_63090 [Streptomyces lavendulae subsp. lavendulae]
MAMRFLFVHGTGVRRERHEALFALVRERLAARFPGAAVESCFWGERFGASMGAGGVSVPGLRTDADGAGDADAAEAAEWGLLLADPLCELRVLAEAGWDTARAADGSGGPEGEDDPFAMPGIRAAGARVLNLLDLLDVPGLPPRRGPDPAPGFPAGPGGPPAPGAARADELASLLHGTGLAPGFRAALDTVARSEEAARAGERATAEPEARELATALARAVAAAALAGAGAGADADCTAAERDRLVELLTARLGGDARVPGARAAAVLGRLAMRVTTQPLLNARRGALTVGATPALGDILRYQARGAGLRAFLHGRITAAPGPTVLIGHSLGGIALVDLLALEAATGGPVPGAELLVTVGSQAPYLHEIGALTALPPGSALPYGFPRWLNVYDRQDVLSYLAAPVFPGDPRVTDHEVISRQPFPASHSAYWKQPSLYERIEQAVAEAGIG